VIKEITKAEKDLLILDAGDLLFKRHVTPFISQPLQKEAILDAQLMVDAFSLMGCDAVGVGDDDLRLSAKIFSEVKKRATFPFISSNVVFNDGHELSAHYVIKNAGGLRWGIFSLMNAHLPPNYTTQDWKVVDPLERGKEVLKDLKERVDNIILLSHMPVRELNILLTQLRGITIAVAGHSSSGLRMPMHVGQTLMVRNYGEGRYLGKLDIYLKDPKASFINEEKIMTLKRNLAMVKQKIEQGVLGFNEEQKANIEAQLKESQKGNTYRNQLILLSSRYQDDQGVKGLMEKFSTLKKEQKKGCPNE
jgi:2',3'-cyclic-nucleotide 2'-phosphodiesterase (5'-nucleotidase family)